MAVFHPTIQPKVHIPDITHPTFYSITSLQWYRGASCAPSFILSEPPLRTAPILGPPQWGDGQPDADPNTVGPSQPAVEFVDWNGYNVLQGLVEARDCEGCWNTVMKAWGSGEEKVLAKNFGLLFNTGRIEDRGRDLDLPRRWQSRTTPGSVSVASVARGSELAHTDVANRPEVLPPLDRDNSGCHLSSFLCLSEQY